MRILQVTATFPPKSFGGVTTAAWHIAKHLCKRGHEVTVFTTDFRDQSSGASRPTTVQEESGMTVRYFKNMNSYLARKRIFTPAMMVPALGSEIADYEIVHLHDFRTVASVAVNRFARRNNVPYILQAHGSITTPFRKAGLRAVFDTFWGPTIVRDAARLIAVASEEAQQYQTMGADCDKTIVIPNGIESGEFRELPQRGLIRARYDIADSNKVILYLGRIHKTKRVDLLVRACARLFRESEDVLLLIAGPDDGDLHRVVGLVRELGITSRVRIVGAVKEEEKQAFFVDADVFVLPSPYEVFGIVTLEALMSGVPTVVSDGCGTADIIRESESGLVARGGDATDLYEKIVSVLLNLEWFAKRASAARGIIQKTLDWSAIVDSMEMVYAQCAKSD